jgi:hypothetical protein
VNSGASRDFLGTAIKDAVVSAAYSSSPKVSDPSAVVPWSLEAEKKKEGSSSPLCDVGVVLKQRFFSSIVNLGDLGNRTGKYCYSSIHLMVYEPIFRSLLKGFSAIFSPCPRTTWSYFSDVKIGLEKSTRYQTNSVCSKHPSNPKPAPRIFSEA